MNWSARSNPRINPGKLRATRPTAAAISNPYFKKGLFSNLVKASGGAEVIGLNLFSNGIEHIAFLSGSPQLDYADSMLPIISCQLDVFFGHALDRGALVPTEFSHDLAGHTQNHRAGGDG